MSMLICLGNLAIWLVGCCIGHSLAAVFVSLGWTAGLVIGQCVEGAEWRAWLQSRMRR